MAKKNKQLLTLTSTLALTLLCVLSIQLAKGQDSRYEPRGKRDPFVPLIGAGKVIATGLEEITSIEDVNLEGIAVGAKGRWVAIINGRILKEGDRAGNLKIIKVNNKTVTLSISDKEFNLNLPEEGGS